METRTRQRMWQDDCKKSSVLVIASYLTRPHRVLLKGRKGGSPANGNQQLVINGIYHWQRFDTLTPTSDWLLTSPYSIKMNQMHML